MTDAPLRVVVLGPGGVGGLVATLLARAGHDVTCLARPDTAAHLDEHGLRLVSDRYGELTARVRGAERLDGPVDACVVATKATALDGALERVRPAALGAAVLVPLLNGVEHLALLRERYPAARTVAGAIRVVASRTGPGEIRHEGQLAAVQLGPGADGLAAALAGAGFDVEVRPDEAGLLWDKLCFLAPVALLTTAAAAPLGAVRDRHGDDLRAVVEEVAAVARAEGAPADAAATWRFTEGVPAGMTSSMQRDAAAGLPTELEAIGGAVLRAAERHGVDVPVTRRIVEELRARLP
ncbi:2-dehydropantoate 2-reductase [Geodermatophilus sp. YIM 151500]|uniref:ketopantoate reductase family protein n=1 Tax=Geodermatophilus sp. YIM 151500 TaxID=2984531 RepID=UPI0021E38F71|nr:2-dehydropantoate 2-reductase [Geodermatophilus sp. YIM 151500]MCV2490579.1 2-dehydropantoate 2-reductase [Geodermatophilus sp. YIM 151500]